MEMAFLMNPEALLKHHAYFTIWVHFRMSATIVALHNSDVDKFTQQQVDNVMNIFCLYGKYILYEISKVPFKIPHILKDMYFIQT